MKHPTIDKYVSVTREAMRQAERIISRRREREDYGKKSESERQISHK